MQSKLTLLQNRSRSSHGHNLCTNCSTLVSDATRFVEISPRVAEKKILKGFYHVRAWWPYWSCDLDYLCATGSTLGQKIFRIINVQSNCPFLSRFSLQMTF